MKTIQVYKAGIHFGEEPIIDGNQASGMINFSGCHLACHFCYTPETSKEWIGKHYSPDEFQKLCEGLVRRGARNLNLISPTQFFGTLHRPLERIRNHYHDLLPIVLKISGYESKPVLDPMADVGHIFLPDFKVWSEDLAKEVGLPIRYGKIALEAIARMMATHGTPRFSEGGKLSRGILIRHLLMPGAMDDSYQVVEQLARIGYRGYLNLMTYFYDPKTRKVTNAPPREVSLLQAHALSLRMMVLVNGKGALAYQPHCAPPPPSRALAAGGSHV